MKAKFHVNNILVTEGVEKRIQNNERFELDVDMAIMKYCGMDWGNLDADDWKINDNAVRRMDDIIFAEYRTCEGDILMVTDMDFETTTILFPHEY